jgi:hypothetical protein
LERTKKAANPGVPELADENYWGLLLLFLLFFLLDFALASALFTFLAILGSGDAALVFASLAFSLGLGAALAGFASDGGSGENCDSAQGD